MRMNYDIFHTTDECKVPVIHGPVLGTLEQVQSYAEHLAKTTGIVVTAITPSENIIMLPFDDALEVLEVNHNKEYWKEQGEAIAARVLNDLADDPELEMVTALTEAVEWHLVGEDDSFFLGAAHSLDCEPVGETTKAELIGVSDILKTMAYDALYHWASLYISGVKK